MRPQAKQILGLRDREIYQAIRFVWLATGCGDAPRPAVYESVRAAAASADRRHWMYGGMQELLLPNSEQIIYAAGSWARAIEISGLGPLRRAAASDVLPIVDVLDAYAHETETLAPVEWVVEEWRRKRGGRVARSTLPQQAYVADLRERRAARGLQTPPMDARGASHVPLAPASTQEHMPGSQWTWAMCVELLARLLLELPPGTRSVTQRKYRELIAGRSYPWPDGLRRAVKKENATRVARGIASDLTVADLWAAAARRAAQLRRHPEPLSPLAARYVERAEVICRFARQHKRWPLKKEIETFADQSLILRSPHRSHAEYVAEAKQLLRSDDPAAFAAVERASQELAAAERERVTKRRREAGARYRARRRERAAPLPRGAPKGTPRADAIAQFADEQDALPSDGMLRYWARELRGMSLAQPIRTHAAELARVRRSRTRSGKSTPTRVLTRRDRHLLRPSSSQPPAIAVRRREWPTDAILASLPEIVAAAAGRTLTVDLWRELTKGRADLPSYSTARKRIKETYGVTFADYISSIGSG